MDEDTINLIKKLRANAKKVRWLVRDSSAEYGHRELVEGSDEWKKAVNRWIGWEQVPWEME